MTGWHPMRAWEGGFSDPVGDRETLKAEVGRLRRLLDEAEDKLAAVTAERDSLKAGRRRWRHR